MSLTCRELTRPETRELGCYVLKNTGGEECKTYREYQNLTFLFSPPQLPSSSPQGLCLLHHQCFLSLVWTPLFSVGLLGRMPITVPHPVSKVTVFLNFSFKCLNAIPIEKAQSYLSHSIKLHYMSQPRKWLLCFLKKYIYIV